MTRNELVDQILYIMDKMTDVLDKGKEPEIKSFKVDDKYTIEVEADVLVDHVDTWKVYLKEHSEYVSNVTINDYDDIQVFEDEINHLLDLRDVCK